LRHVQLNRGTVWSRHFITRRKHEVESNNREGKNSDEIEGFPHTRISSNHVNVAPASSYDSVASGMPVALSGDVVRSRRKIV